MTPSPLRISPAPPARPVRRPSKQRKAQSPSRCRDWKTEGDGHKLRLSAETGMGSMHLYQFSLRKRHVYRWLYKYVRCLVNILRCLVDILDYVRWHICNIISYHHIINIVGVCIYIYTIYYIIYYILYIILYIYIIYILCIRACCDSGNVSLLTPLLPDSGFDPSPYGGFQWSWMTMT